MSLLFYKKSKQTEYRKDRIFFAAGVTLFIVIGLFSVLEPSIARASSTSGTIDSTNRYAWTENAGWLDFGGSLGAVTITDSALTGYAFGENIGWVSLNCSNDNSCATVDYKVSNDGNGTLSGYAYGENVGWIRFDPANGGVSINSSGEFTGYAYGENVGWIVFNCSTTSSCGTVDYKVSTDYRPQNSRPACNNSLDDDSDGKTDYPTDPGCTSADDTSETDAVLGNGAPGAGGGGSPSFSGVSVPSSGGVAAVGSVVPVTPILEKVGEAISALIPSFFKPAPKAEMPVAELPLEQTLSKTTPLAFSNTLDLISASTVGRFVLAPLPSEITALTKKFPELGKTLTKLGITKISDLDKLKDTKFVLPGLSENVGVKDLSGLSLLDMTLKQKQAFPSEIVFAKTGDLIDYNIHLSMTDAGNPEQVINTIAGKTLDLIVKPDKPAKNVKGYLVVKNIERQLGRTNVPQTSLMAAPIMAVLGTSLSASENVKIEEKMVLDKFEYEDENGDGIYTTSIQAPLVHGEYEVISIIEYKNSAYGKKELRLTAVVDPEGYIYEKNGNKETRIPDAKVSLMWKNPKTEKFELWPAKTYQQVNPQKTDKSGTYSFLVPEGTYKLTVSASGYNDFSGQEFDVNEGRGVHENISLQPKNWFRRLLNALF
ncbi:MAG: hypothetical protein A2664_02170 [Candidatus Taylorbacteria bacterium RIFCSPHIGHO2_01_FULL_46_22b]|uniref:Uncharacterized protein n=1 Tax=Candidatus Taylorbacteria bacterium RIFCSPHIGHO2_01_FULL_46_22b TaxID=1802301 RepID=A0A1G2M565_9BACT|nr:MAG: hypothetical protein A2664_02170 [Candidatus Taylorbacteria bacterium RIFCSPHIGHO2_01_FULL_46_22b]